MSDKELIKEARKIIADVMGDLVIGKDFYRCAEFLDKTREILKRTVKHEI